MTTMIFFVRHGESEANRKDVFAGQRDDSPLTPKGRHQAEVAADDAISKSIVFNKIITSPLQRARETATIMAKRLQYDMTQIVVDNRLQEYDMGILSGLPKKDIRPIDYINAEGAEDVTEFQKRVIAVIDELRSYHGNVLIVSHSGVGRMIEATRIRLPIQEFYGIPSYPNAFIVEIK
jgi:broad specificity phosphatase PhoE